jgi:hypothetical protein
MSPLLIANLEANGVGSLIDDWEHDWPLLRGWGMSRESSWR